MRLLGVIFQGGTNLPDGIVQTLLEVHKSFGTPNLFRQFLSCDYLAGMAHEERQDFGRLRLKLQRRPIAA